MLQRFVKTVGGNPHRRLLQELSEEIEDINALESDFEKLADDDLRVKTADFRTRISAAGEPFSDEKERYSAEQEALEEILPQAFALVREAAKRTIRLRHYDVQLIGGLVLHRGQIAEMKTGEGKTLAATLSLYLNSLLGRGAYLITQNDYLARRDAYWFDTVMDKVIQ